MKELLTCPICQNQFQTLNSHIHFKHNLSTEEFLNQYPNTKLVSDFIKNRVSKSCKKSGCGKWMKGYEYTEERREQYSAMNSGSGNPFYGKTHSKKTRKQMSDNHADFTGDKNPLVKWLEKDPNNRKKYCDIMKENWAGRFSTEEERRLYCEKLSKSISNLYINGFNPYSNCERGWFESKKFNEKFYYGSSYEKKFLQFCETSIKVKSLQRVPFMIPYLDNTGKTRNYVADFLVNGTEVVEIKPKEMLPYNNNLLKIESAKTYCNVSGLKFKLLMEDELDNLE
jgi:hypothetical protein